MPSSKHSKISVKTAETHVVLQGQTADAQPTVTFAMQQQALRIAHAMQTTLDIYGLLKRFTKELKEIVPFHSLGYENQNSEHSFLDGTPNKHSAHYNLTIEKESLGALTLTRNSEFSEAELILIENALSQLMLPLRNSLTYHEALVSSLTDKLTKLGNRSAYECAIKKEFEFCKRHQIDLAILVCDLDKFKKINDTFGHQAGDEVLVSTAKVLAEACRDSDIVFRYGGEEFVVILKNCNQEGAQALADRIRTSLANETVNYHDKAIHVSTSIGITNLSTSDSIESLFNRADKALYEAKRQGGNKTVIG